MKNIKYYASIFLILISCTNSKDIKKSTKTIISIDLIKDTLRLSSLGVVDSIIILETKSESLISRIDKVIFTDLRIYILDRDGGKGIYVFSKNGRFVRNYCKIGTGPEEYLTIEDFTYDRKNGIFYILNNRKEVSVIDTTGKFIKSFRNNFPAMKIEVNSKYKRLYFIGDNEDFNLIVTDLNGKRTAGYFPNSEFKTHIRVLNNPFQNMDSIIIYRRYLDDNIYQLSGDEMSVRYNIDFGQNSLDHSNLIKLLEIQGKKPFEDAIAKYKTHIKYYLEDKKFIYFLFFTDKMPCLCIYDKGSGLSGSYLYTYLKEDLFNSSYFPILEYVNEKNNLVFFTEPEVLKKYLNSQKSYLITTKKYKDKILNLNAMSNPILISIK